MLKQIAAINSQVYSVCVHECGLRGWQNRNYTDVDHCTEQTLKIKRNLAEKYFKKSTILQHGDTE